MSNFEISAMSDSSVLGLVDMRESIQIDPEYQRPGGVWSLAKKQLFIDSLINRYDIPKFYFHHLIGAHAEEGMRYAIIDGKQRLQAIWDFFDGEFALSRDFVYSDDPSIDAKNMKYNQIADKFPRLIMKLHARTLSVQTVLAEDLDFIEDMFSRLNEAVPLAAAEKRNAFGGPLPTIFREVSQHPFFTNKIKVSPTRYRHHDLVAKLIYLQFRSDFVDTKKASLDHFVKSGRADDFDHNLLASSVDQVLAALAELEAMFVDNDDLVRSTGMIVVYFLLVSKLLEEGRAINFGRSELIGFEELRRRNRELFASDENENEDVDFKLIEFDELAQSSNDGSAIQRRYELLREHLT
ncbi:DUF262 domain-containing protein [uncultured Ruegeria sp.]|uniref:DUF262 domain-containing protein n=1 Tax=uncultured Ruegeria sp. TaxID=259304 RepID=UPI002630D6C2|nr:DUF262 domain-containing protein [uncultured Ruegeria sp.]